MNTDTHTDTNTETVTEEGVTMGASGVEPLKPRSAGRPKKSELAKVKNKNKGIIGRPKGDTAIINEYKQRMLSSPKSAKVLEAIYDAALNDDHKNQAAAWKLIVDRIVPVSAFEASKSGGSAPAISINISGLTSPTVQAHEEVQYDISDVEPKA